MIKGGLAEIWTTATPTTKSARKGLATNAAQGHLDLKRGLQGGLTLAEGIFQLSP